METPGKTSLQPPAVAAPLRLLRWSPSLLSFCCLFATRSQDAQVGRRQSAVQGPKKGVCHFDFGGRLNCRTVSAIGTTCLGERAQPRKIPLVWSVQACASVWNFNSFLSELPTLPRVQ
eukprot:4155816-Amphidinium_carterae.1